MTFKVEVESDYIGTSDSHHPTSSQSNRPIIPLPSNGNRTGKLRVRVYPWVRSGRNLRHGSGTGTGKHYRRWVRVG